jgi:hypothetical protein
MLRRAHRELDLRGMKWREAGRGCTEFCNLARFTQYCCGDQNKEGEKFGSCSTHREIRNSYKSSAGKPEGKRELGKPWCKWEDN